jgi:phosphoribosylanthranilate isomerase
MWVKICGITRREDAWLAADLGAAAVGFIFWPGSRRFIEPTAAGDIVRGLPASVVPVGVFVNQPAEHVNAVAQALGLGAVQLHGVETPEYCARVAVPVIKAVPVGGDFRVAAVADLPAGVTVLLDVDDPVAHGGTGRTVDWTAAREVARVRRTILAGGLTPENVGAAIRAVEPAGIDVSSGVESAPGIKDECCLRRFFDAIASSATGGKG